MENVQLTVPVDEKPKKKDTVGFIVFRMIFVILIALFVICMRYFNPDIYKQIKYYYDNYISVNITADYYLSEENSSDKI